MAPSAEPTFLLTDREMTIVSDPQPADHPWQSVVECFAARRQADPDGIAVTGSYGTLTFDQLGSLADRVAGSLIAAGAGRTGYLGERDVHFLAAFLGVFGAGLGYVPLDPAWPAARLAEIAAGAELSHVLTDDSHAELADGLGSVCRVSELLTGGMVPPATTVNASTLAYLVFTSGSTGHPKGVLIEHGALLNNCLGIAGRWRLGPTDRVLQFTTLGVNITLEEAFCAWSSGAALVLMEPTVPSDLVRFTRFLAEHRVTTLDLPTSFWLTWLDALEAGDVPAPPSCLRVVAVGSEEVGSPDIARWHARLGPGTEIYNMYGSTEQAITSIVAGPIGADDPVGTGVIGTPLPGVLAYVLDGELRRLPAGVPGELFVGGAAVGRGYVGQPGRTAASFRPDPFAGVPGARMYATGDRAVALVNGSFRFAGRLDDRLKIRGFTVQPREIELLLADLAGVRSVTVSAEAGPDGRDHVVAELLTDLAEEQLDGLVAEARSRADQRLPEPSRPVRYRFRLAGQDAIIARPAHQPVQSTGRSEPAVAGWAHESALRLWQELIGQQQVAESDSFLDIGGNSLMVTQLLTRLRSRHGVRLDFAQFIRQPTLAVTAAAIAAAGDRPADPAAVQRLPRTDSRTGPCWSGQRRMWLLQQLLPSSAAYNLPLCFEVTGELDRDRLAAALNQVVARHEPLRTALRLVEGELLQSVVNRTVPVERLAGGRTLSAELQDADSRLTGFIAEPFRLADGEVIRAALIDCRDGRTLFAVVLHHAAFDEWSAPLLVAELRMAYAASEAAPSEAAPSEAAPSAAATSEAAPSEALPELPARYLDFSTWYAEDRFRDTALELAGFWRDYLGGLPGPLPLPADRDAPRRPSGAGDQIAFEIGSGQAAALRSLAQREGVTLFHALLTLYATLLSRHTGQTDFAVGVPTSTRRFEEVEQLIGLFVNTLPVRVDLTDNPRFAEAVRRLSESTLAAQAAGELGLDEIVRATGSTTTDGQNPIFQTMFLMDEAKLTETSLAGGARLAPLEIPARTSTQDLTLILGEDGDRLAGRLWFATDRFDRSSAERLVRSLLELVTEVTADPDQRVQEFGAVTAADRALVAGPATAPDELRPVAVQVAAVAERWPDRIAVIDGDRTLTYAQLLRLVGQLRHRLHAAGPGTGFVPLLLPGGVAMLAAMLAVNSLGLAFVPLDPQWPAARIEQVLEELDSPVLVLSDDQPAPAGNHRLVPVEPDGQPVAGLDTPWPRTAQELDRPMYAIYTSGSTGRPKGAIALHRGIANRFAWMSREFGEQAAESVLQTTAPVYDSCVWEYLWPLTTGGRTLLSGPSLQADPHRLLDTIARHRVRTLDLVPSMLDGLLRAAESSSVAPLAGLALVVVGGEELSRQVARRFAELELPARLVNLYGPTEASIGSMFHEVGGQERGRVLIGLPIDNTGAAVLDARRQVVARNVVGELYLAGDCVGAGYLGGAGLTRRRFVENRYPDALPGQVLYRTGDLARMRASGEVEFLGRVDEQIKIRGVRIEPAEVAAALRRHPAVAEVAVMALPAPEPAVDRGRVRALLAAAEPGLAAAALLRVRAGTTSRRDEHAAAH